MSAIELGDIKIAHDLAVAYATLSAAHKTKTIDKEAFYHEYEAAYEEFIILICEKDIIHKKDNDIKPRPL